MKSVKREWQIQAASPDLRMMLLLTSGDNKQFRVRRSEWNTAAHAYVAAGTVDLSKVLAFETSIPADRSSLS